MIELGKDFLEVKTYEESDGKYVEIELWYPRIEDNIKSIQISLGDVRAADNIRIQYDFERDGWSIQQAG